MLPAGERGVATPRCKQMTTRRRAQAQLERAVGLAVAVAGGFMGSQIAAAQNAGAVNVDVAECVKLESPEERFACYEKRVGARLEQGDTNPAPANAAAEPARPAEPPPEILGTIVALRETVPDSFVITLDNGQVWRQTAPKEYPLRVGHKVRVYSTRFGQRLSAQELNGFIRVEQGR